jgi:hypothetical protein
MGSVEEVLSDQFQDDALRIVDEIADRSKIDSQRLLYVRGAAVSHSKPDDFRRAAAEYRELGDVAIFGYEDVAVRSGVEPKLRVAGALEAEKARLSTVWINVCKPGDQLVRQVVIEKQLHA